MNLFAITKISRIGKFLLELSAKLLKNTLFTKGENIMKNLLNILKLTLIVSFGFAFFAPVVNAERMKAVKMQEFWNIKKKPVEKKVVPKKKKDEVKVDREALKKKVTTRKNGDILTPELAIPQTVAPNLPRYLDAIIGFYFPWVDIKPIDEALAALAVDKNRDNTVKNRVDAINNILQGGACRLNSIQPSLGTIKKKLSDGITLYWIGYADEKFFGFARFRNEKRNAFTDPSLWKKELQKQKYNTQDFEFGAPEGFLVMGVNAETGEVAISPTNTRTSMFFISLNELKQLNVMLLEPSW